MPAPVFLVTTPLILALLTVALNRWPRLAVSCGVASTMLLAIIVTTVPVDTTMSRGEGGLISGNTWEILGRTLVLTGQIQTALLFILAIMALLFLLTLLFHQGSTFVPVSLALLSPLAAVLMIRPFLFGAATLVVVAAMLTILIQGGRVGSTLAAFRLLTMAVIAVPLLLIAGWILESGQALSAVTVARLLLISIVILLAGFPFHIWVAPIVTESRALVPIVVFGLAQLIITLFCFNLILENPAVGLNAQFVQLLRASAGGTVLVGGVLAVTAQSFGRLLGYSLLIDVGSLILSFAFGGVNGLEVAASLVLLRTIGLLMAGFGLCLLRNQFSPETQGSDRLAVANAMLRRSPLGSILFFYGCLSLIGLPLTPGFSVRWAILLLPGGQSAWLVSVWVLSITLATIGVLRFLLASSGGEKNDIDHYISEPIALRIVAGLLLGLGIFFAIFPQSLLSIARALAQFS